MRVKAGPKQDAHAHSAKVPGLNLFYRERLESVAHRMEKAMQLEMRLRTGDNKWSFHQRLQKFTELTDLLVRLVIEQNDLIHSYGAQMDQLAGLDGERSRKRWTQLEDEALVDEACHGDATLIKLSLTFNRTPAAVSSRLTYLVGVSRVNRAVAGRLIGYLDGEAVDGHFQGRLTDVERA